MAQRPPPPALDQILFVEGAEDQHVIYQLCNAHQLANRTLFEVHPVDGVEAAIRAFEAAAVLKEKRAIGLIIDADADAAGRWAQVRQRLAKLGHDVGDPSPGGLIVEGSDSPRLGVWLMPDNVLPGALEDFVATLVPPGDALWVRAEQTVAEIPPEDRRFKVPIKATIHTWLAWQKEPGGPMGLAINKRYLDGDQPSARAVIAWLRRLFAAST